MTGAHVLSGAVLLGVAAGITRLKIGPSGSEGRVALDAARLQGVGLALRALGSRGWCTSAPTR
jgi:hypothetical protein